MTVAPSARVVVLSSVDPSRTPETAGAVYVCRVRDALVELWGATDVCIICPSDLTSGNVAESTYPSGVRHADPTRLRPISRLVARGIGKVDRVLRWVDPALPPLEFAATLVLDPQLRAIIKSADRIDLQWLEYLRLAPMLRQMNPDAEIVGTSHDVVSQLVQRRRHDASGVLRRAKYRVQAQFVTSAEARAIRRLDVALALSEQDREQLSVISGREINVIHPPLGGDFLPRPFPSPTTVAARVVFLANFGRDVNVQAADWLIHEIWPAVIANFSSARLRLVGRDPHGAVLAMALTVDTVEFAGFVEDLEEVYSDCDVAVIPLLAGSGVKFKAIEAVIRGIPTVSTPVGAEGIGGNEVFFAVCEDAAGFSEAVVHALRDHAEACSQARQAATQISDRYSMKLFHESIARIHQRR